MNVDMVGPAVEKALGAGHFFVQHPRRLRIESVPDERTPWELFRGHVLDAAQARQVVNFVAWHVFVDGDDAPAASPLVSILWQREAGCVVAVRQILSYGFEAYEESPGVIQSRPVEKWARELVGTIELATLPPDEWPREFGRYLFLAVIGTSRLPITSLESPLPAFSLGQLAYLPSLDGSLPAWTDPIAIFRAALDADIPLLEQAKALEMALRAVPREGLGELIDTLSVAAHGPRGTASVGRLLRELFNSVALSPYTDFVDRLIGVLGDLAANDRLGAAAVADIFSYMLRHLCRHLAAFDLTLFHNFGANYPDALLLDGLLKANLRLLEEHDELWRGRDAAAARRRRAMRQACLARKRYEGHRVPDAPTSLGENLRVLPAPFVRVPEDEIVSPVRRRRTLFVDDPLENLLTPAGREALTASLADLADPAELTELGMAHFLDRPLGVLKQPGEVDRTPLVSYETFSRSLVKRRLTELESMGWNSSDDRERFLAATEGLEVGGVPLGALSLLERPGVVSLADAHKAAPDFVVLRTTRQSLERFTDHYDIGPLAELAPEVFEQTVDVRLILVHHAPEGQLGAMPALRIYDARGQLRLELGFAAGSGGAVNYVERGGVELVERLQVLRAWEPRAAGDPVERNLAGRSVWLNLRGPASP